MQRAHAIANGVFVAAVNRVGHEGPADGGLEFWGGSFLADPFGRILARAGRDTRGDPVVACDPRLQEETRRNWPFLRDRRIDAYGPITQRFLDGRHEHADRRPRPRPDRQPTPTPAARLPDARRVGAARGDLDRLAPQPRRLARQVRADPLGLRRDRPPPEPGRAGPHPRRRAARCSDARPTGSTRAGSTSTRVAFVKAATDRVWLRDSGPTFVVNDEAEASRRARRPDRLEVQRLGEVRQLPARRPPAPRGSRAGSACARWTPRVEVDGRPAPRRDGRRRDRRQRPGDAADDRGMPAQRRPGPQPRARPRGDRAGLRRLPRRPPRRSGSAEGSPATTRTATSTTSPGSSTRRRSSPSSSRDADDPNHEPLQENLRRLQAARDQDGQPLRVVDAADARAGRLRRPAAAGQLRQLLHRQRPRARPDLQRPGRPRGPRTPWPRSSPTARSSASTPSTSSGAWARCTACRSSSRGPPALPRTFPSPVNRESH